MDDSADLQKVSLRIGGKDLLVADVGPGSQKIWSLRSISQALYPASGDGPWLRKMNQKLKTIWDDVTETHRLMWPNVQVPRRATLDGSHGHSFQVGVPTSVMFAFVVWGNRAPKRSRDSRLIAEEFLADLVAHLAGFDFDLVFPKFEARGARVPSRQSFQAGSDLVVDCWTRSMSRAIALEWDRDMNSEGRPHTTRSRTGIADFLIWAFRPFPQQAHCAELFRERKQLLEQSAFSMVTHLALAFDTKVVEQILDFSRQPLDASMESGEEEVELSKRGKKRKISSTLASAVAEKAARLLYNGDDTWIPLKRG